MELDRKLEILNALVDEGRRFPADGVYRVDGALVATNGTQLLAFRCEYDAPTIDDRAEEVRMMAKAEKRSAAPEAIRGWLTREANGRNVDSQAFLEFLKADEYLKCHYCSGSGRRPAHEPDLEYGWMHDPFERPRIVDLDGALINVNLLLGVLAHLPMGETLSLETWPEHGHAVEGRKEGHILRIVGDGWTLIQMSMTQVQGYEVEAYPLDALAAIP